MLLPLERVHRLGSVRLARQCSVLLDLLPRVRSLAVPLQPLRHLLLRLLGHLQPQAHPPARQVLPRRDLLRLDQVPDKAARPDLILVFLSRLHLTALTIPAPRAPPLPHTLPKKLHLLLAHNLHALQSTINFVPMQTAKHTCTSVTLQSQVVL